MPNLPDIVLLGSLSIDRIMNFAGRYEDVIQKDKLHVLSLSILIDQLEHTNGGVAANIAYNLSLLGDSPVLLTSLGTDGQAYLASLGNRGIDVSNVWESQLPTSTFTVMTDSNDCQVGGFYPGAMSDSDSLTLSPWAQSDAIIVVSPYDPATMARLVNEAHVHRLRLVYDIGQQVSNVPAPDLLAGLTAAELLIVNDYELGVLSSRTNLSEEAIKRMVPVCVTTLGSQGSVIEGKSVPKPIKIGIPPGIKIVDPTGAGDAYRAGFLYGYRRGWDLGLCGRVGSCTASFAVQYRGTQVHTFDKTSLAKRYQTAFNKPIALNN